MFKKGAHVVFAFSDAAGANACLAQAFIIQKENQCSVTCFSNKPVDTTPWKISVIVKEKLTEHDLQSSDVLFTGTSHPTTSGYFELHAIRLAKAKKIPAIAFVDHWTSIRMRFELKGETILPDEIWITDERAKNSAIKQGLPEASLFIKKNPYLVYLSSHWKSAYPQKSFIKKSGLTSGKKNIVIAPDPISLRTKDFNPGFTEITALHELLETFERLDKPCTIVIKAHPLQPIEALRSVLNQHTSLDLRLLVESNNPELIHIADLVIGFYSNFLLEADAMHKPVLRYFPGNLSLDPLGHLPHLTPISNPSEALLSLQAIL